MRILKNIALPIAVTMCLAGCNQNIEKHGYFYSLPNIKIDRSDVKKIKTSGKSFIFYNRELNTVIGYADNINITDNNLLDKINIINHKIDVNKFDLNSICLLNKKCSNLDEKCKRTFAVKISTNLMKFSMKLDRRGFRF